MLIKYHVPYSLNSTSVKLLSQINFFIFLLTSSALVYLSCLGYSTKYKFFLHSLPHSYILHTFIITSILIGFHIHDGLPSFICVLCFIYEQLVWSVYQVGLSFWDSNALKLLCSGGPILTYIILYGESTERGYILDSLLF